MVSLKLMVACGIESIAIFGEQCCALVCNQLLLNLK